MTRGRLSLLLALALVACATAPEKTPAPSSSFDDTVRALRAHFERSGSRELLNDDLEPSLDGLVVPADPQERARLLRAALARPALGGDARVAAKWGEPPLEALVATPAGYDPAALYPTMLGLAAYGSDAHQSLRPFAVPREERALAPDSPTVPWQDGLVVAPTLAPMDENDPATFAKSRARILDALARANRSFAVDPDQTYVAGYSLGAAIAYDVASRHPDRFAAIADVSGGCPLHPTPLENMRNVPVYLRHSEDDDTVPVRYSREIAARLDEIHVPHALEIVATGGHSWPQTPAAGAKLVSWLRARRRNAWPRELDLIFAASAQSYRVYWLEVPPSEKNRRVLARAQGNVITIASWKGVPSVVLHLGEPLVDLDREVVVRTSEKELFRGKLERRMRTLALDLETDGWDTTRAAPARLEVRLDP